MMMTPEDLADARALAEFVARVHVDEDAVRARARSLWANARSTTTRDIDTLIGCLDLTSLRATDSPSTVERLCDRACAPDPEDPSCPRVAAVCVHADLVEAAVVRLEGTGVRVAAVAGAFPHGRSPLAVRCAEVSGVVAAGADEVDIVVDRAAMREGRYVEVVGDLRALVDASAGATVKVILEHAELGDVSMLSAAAHLALLAGAHAVKTSTGTVQPGATPEAALVLCDAVRDHEAATGRRAAVKVAGGVRESADALGYLACARAVLGHRAEARLRLGASQLLDDLVAQRRAR